MELIRRRTSLPWSLASLDFLRALRWIDETPLPDHVELYRQRLFARVLRRAGRERARPLQPRVVRARQKELEIHRPSSSRASTR